MAFRECSTNNAFSPATLDDSVIRKYQIEANIFLFMVNIVQVDRNVRGSQKTIERMFQNEVSQSHSRLISVGPGVSLCLSVRLSVNKISLRRSY